MERMREQVMEQVKIPGKNEIVPITIEDIGAEGEGIGKVNGFTLFVKDAVVGDELLVKVMKIKKTYGYARIEKIVTPSTYRVTPKCEIAAKCGGCQIQQLSYEEQLRYKQNKVLNCLKRIGGIENPPIEPIVSMENPYHYRNKAQFPVGRSLSGEVVIGFYAGRTHSIIDTTKCYIGDESTEPIVACIRNFIKRQDISIYDEEKHQGLVRHILLRVGFTSKELMICLVINGNTLPSSEKLVKELLECKDIPEGFKVTSICLNKNTQKTNVILGEKIIPLYGNTYITDLIGEIQYQISPLSFYQVNPIQTKKLYDLALDYAGLTGNELVWDLYCGIGTISLFLAKKAKKVYGVEIIPQAIEDAKKNALLNGITNAEFFVGAAEDVLPMKYKESNGKIYADVIVVDPPRKGCEESLLETIVAMEPKRVVYVSCDPATLARDLKYLIERGYQLRKVRPVDQFPHSVHVETVVLLSQQRADDHIEIDLDLDELDATSAEMKATYNEIQQYVMKETGLMVSNLYIAQVKKKCGIDVGESFNKPKSENARQPKCPADKEKAIKDAFVHFGMI